MNIPKGYSRPAISKKIHVLKLLKKLYGQKQRPRVWNKILETGLLQAGFEISQVGLCLYYRGQVVFLVYINDCILFSPCKNAIDDAIKDIWDANTMGGRKFTMEDQGDVNDFSRNMMMVLFT